jgi:predicted permease
MRWLRAAWHRTWGFVGGHRRTEQFDEELQSHIELHVEDNLRRGMAPDEARRRALAALGGVQSVREAHRDRAGLPGLDALMQDVRFAVRVLRQAPGFTATAALILALGVGANAAVFSLINAVLIRPVVPGLDHDDLVGVYAGDRTRPDRFRPFVYEDYVALRDATAVFAGLIAEEGSRTGLTENGRTRRIDAMRVSSNYFSVLGVPLAAGRAFTATEERPGTGAAVAVVSHDFWSARGMPRDIIGSRIVLNGQNVTVVGVAGDGFHGTMPAMSRDVWLPLGSVGLLGAVPPRQRAAGTSGTLLLAGRLQPGLSVGDATARLEPLARSLAAAAPERNVNLHVLVATRSRTALSAGPKSDSGATAGAAVLMTVAGLVLLVACLNLANMLLARGGARQQEIAVRLALGGGRARVVRQLVVEGLLLAILGGTAALVVSWWAAERFVATIRGLGSGTIVLDVSPDARVMATIVLASIGSMMVFSLVPALRLSNLELATTMKASALGRPARRRRFPLPSILVSGQIALCLTLLVAAGVFLRSSGRAALVEPGFPMRGGVIAHLDAELIGLDETRVRDAYGDVLARVRALPGVAEASLASIVPLDNDSEGTLVRRDARQSDGTPLFATYTVIGARYFATLGLPLLSGREFTAAEERQAAAPVAIVDRTLAEEVFGGGDPTGRFVQMVNWDGSPAESLQIVGVVPTVRDDVLEVPDQAHVYVPFGNQYRGQMRLHARVTAGTETVMSELVRQTIRDVDAALPVAWVRTWPQHREASLSLWGVLLAARVFGLFGAIALTLATVGVYGLRAYLVGRRTREIGIRVALGATRHGITAQLLREGGRLAAIGLGVGAVLATGVVQLFRGSGMLVDAALVDPVVFALAAAVLAAATTVASYLPARRALQIDPATALRPE